MKTIFVPDHEWNSHWNSVEEAVETGRREYDDYPECHEFTMVRLEVFAATTYRIVDGTPVVVSPGFPEHIEMQS